MLLIFIKAKIYGLLSAATEFDLDLELRDLLNNNDESRGKVDNVKVDDFKRRSKKPVDYCIKVKETIFPFHNIRQKLHYFTR